MSRPLCPPYRNCHDWMYAPRNNSNAHNSHKKKVLNVIVWWSWMTVHVSQNIFVWMCAGECVFLALIRHHSVHHPNCGIFKSHFSTAKFTPFPPLSFSAFILHSVASNSRQGLCSKQVKWTLMFFLVPLYTTICSCPKCGWLSWLTICIAPFACWVQAANRRWALCGWSAPQPCLRKLEPGMPSPAKDRLLLWSTCFYSSWVSFCLPGVSSSESNRCTDWMPSAKISFWC